MLKRMIAIFGLCLPAPAFAQDGWDYTATFYGWFPGASTTVETPLGEVEAEVDFDEIFDALDLAFFGAIDARKGRWSFTGDLLYADLSTDVAPPSGVVFGGAEVETQMTLVSAYASYAIVDSAKRRFELGGGLRVVDATIDTLLIGQGEASDVRYSDDGSWADLVIAARYRHAFNENWYGMTYADVGGFGIDDSSDLTWQAVGGVGYRFTPRWSALGGYRHLSIERGFGPTDITAEISGPFLGIQASF